MSNEDSAALETYLSNPTGALRVKRVKIGRIEFEDILIQGREAAINLQELFNTACEKTQRFRVRKDGTRYPEPLPLGAPARLLSAEANDYLRDQARRNLQARTIEATARSLEILKITTGDIPVSRIDRRHIYLLWDLLRWAPPNVTTDPTLKGLTAEELITLGKAANVPTPAIATYELHRRFLTTFFGSLVKTHAIPYSPMDAFAEMKKDLVEDPDRVVRLFTDDDLLKIFAPESFIPWARKYPHRWWAPILGLYTGLRINEAAQLKVADIIDERGVWCLAIRKTVDEDLAGRPGARSRQRLKGKSAVRCIPIPQPVLDAGFLEFVEDMREFGHPRLFPHLSSGVNKKTGGSNGRYSQALLNQFSVYLKDRGFRKGLGFHAFRHTLATDLDHKGVREEDVALITGHSVNKKVPVLQDHYYHRKPEAVRARQVAALDLYRPPVELPVYERGQFQERLGRGAKIYP